VLPNVLLDTENGDLDRLESKTRSSRACHDFPTGSQLITRAHEFQELIIALVKRHGLAPVQFSDQERLGAALSGEVVSSSAFATRW